MRRHPQGPEARRFGCIIFIVLFLLVWGGGGLGIKGSGFRGLGFRVQGLGVRVIRGFCGSGFGVSLQFLCTVE